MQQFLRLRDVRSVVRRAFHVVNEPGLIIQANVRLHPKVLLFALHGLVHSESRLLSSLVELGAAMIVHPRSCHHASSGPCVTHARSPD